MTTTTSLNTESPDSSVALLARSAGLAFLGRLGGLLESVGLLIFAALYNVSVLGLFYLMVSYLELIVTLTDLGMGMAFQRFIPRQERESDIHAIVGRALFMVLGANLLIAAALSLAAPVLAPLIHAGIPETNDLTFLIRIYAWAVPLWSFIELATAAVRARKTFGPEIRIRIFYEQSFRIAAGVMFYIFGWHTAGLFAAHLLSLFLAAILAGRLLFRLYDPRQLLTKSEPAREAGFRPLLSYGIPLLSHNIGRKLQSNLPVFVLNAMIPGAAGAAAVGIYAVGRKIVSALQAIRDSFEYVLAPLSSFENRAGDLTNVREMYAFATRLIFTLFIPVATVLVIFRNELLMFLGTEYKTAATLIVILTLGRTFEAAMGPSSAIIAMIGQYRWPVVNAFLGVTVTAVLLALLIPRYGIAGAAIAAATGLSLSALAALSEVYFLHHLQPFDARLIRPLAATLILSGCYVLALHVLMPAPPILAAVAGIGGFLGILYILARFGLSATDRQVMGLG